MKKKEVILNIIGCILIIAIELFIIITVNPFIQDLVVEFADELGYSDTKIALLQIGVLFITCTIILMFNDWVTSKLFKSYERKAI